MRQTMFRFLRLLTAVTVICMILFLFWACQSSTTTDQLLSESELLTCEMYVHNVTCSKVTELRTVADDTFKESVVSLCTEAAPFRPIISSDIVLGEQCDAYFILKNSTAKYTICFFDAEKQLSLDYIYRDAPMFSVEIAEIDELGQPQVISRWYCSLPAKSFALLYDVVQTYTAGEVIQ